MSSGPPSYASSSPGENESFKSTSKDHSSKVAHEKSTTKSSSPRDKHRQVSLETLKSLTGDRIRRSRCDTEFLEGVARSGSLDGHDTKGKFNIIVGKEALKFYQKFLEENDSGDATDAKPDENNNPPTKSSLQPVVFAITVLDAGRKVVDYYMSWRGKTRARHLQGDERLDILKSEFKRVAKKIDREYKRASLASPPSSAISSVSSPLSERTVDLPALKIPPPPVAPISPPSEVPHVIMADAVTARSSVTSLPLLNMMRNVPMGNRMILRVTNPDVASINSSRNSVISLTGDTSKQDAKRETLPAVPEEAPLESITNTFTTESPNSETPSTDEHRSPLQPSINIMSGGRASSSKSSSSKRSKHSRSSTKEKEKEVFNIVLLDEPQEVSSSTRTWHGLERQTSTKSLGRTPSARSSPWSGPLAHGTDGISYSSPPSRSPSYESEDSSSDDEGGWKNAPVIPMKAQMIAQGLIPPDHPRIEPPLVPAHHQYRISMATHFSSPYMATSPYVQSSPYLISTPYVNAPSPAWSTASLQIPNTPVIRPTSYTTMVYSSPYMQSQY